MENIGTTIGVIKGDTGSLDKGSHGIMQVDFGVVIVEYRTALTNSYITLLIAGPDRRPTSMDPQRSGCHPNATHGKESTTTPAASEKTKL